MQKVRIKFSELKPNELRIKITYAGLCQSDLNPVRQDWFSCPYPIAPGHEIVGVAIKVGSAVTKFKVGDKVGFGWSRESCGKCKPCRSGNEQLCFMTNPQLDQGLTYGPKYWGGHASHMQQPADWFLKIPSNLPENRVSPLFCAGLSLYTPIARHAKPGDEVAIFGVGGLGHMGVQYAKAWGCKVTAFTSSKGREEFIKKLGADRVVAGSAETYKQEAGKFDVVLNTLPSSDNFSQYLGLTAPLGIFVQLDAPAFNKPAEINSTSLIFGHIKFTESLTGSRRDVENMLVFSAKHNIVPLYDYENFPKAFNKLENGKSIFRCVVNCSHAH